MAVEANLLADLALTGGETTARSGSGAVAPGAKADGGCVT